MELKLSLPLESVATLPSEK